MTATINRNPSAPVSVRIIGNDGKTYFASFQRESDAVLFTASPDLLGACKAAKAFGSQGETEDGISVSYLIGQAIAKAEGCA